MSNQHEWQFDNAWQEMLNHATIKVMDAETQRAASGREHQTKTMLFHAAEQRVLRRKRDVPSIGNRVRFSRCSSWRKD